MASKEELKKIMSDEGLSDWKLKLSSNGGGIALLERKKIVVDGSSFPMFLHELAHAITGERHTGKFADKFTALVKKYTVSHNLLEAERKEFGTMMVERFDARVVDVEARREIESEDFILPKQLERVRNILFGIKNGE